MSDDEVDDWGDLEVEDDSAPMQIEDNSVESEVLTKIQNNYDEADSIMKSNPTRALQLLNEAIDLESKHCDNKPSIKFTALKHIVSLNLSLGRIKDMINSYHQLLSLSNTLDLSRDELRDAINSVLNSVSNISVTSDNDINTATLQKEIYSYTTQWLRERIKSSNNSSNDFNAFESGNFSLYFDTQMKLCSILFESGEIDEVKTILNELHNSCKDSNGNDDTSDPRKGSRLMKIYAYYFRCISFDERERYKLKSIFERTKGLITEINDSETMGYIHEAWAKLYGMEGHWDKAYSEFFDAFKNFQLVGHRMRKESVRCLKYLVIASIGAESISNPFSATEVKPFENDRDIRVIVQLRTAFEKKDLINMKSILESLSTDEFINLSKSTLINSLLSAIILSLVQPYSTIRLAFLAQAINISDITHLEKIVTALILDGKLNARINQIDGVLSVQKQMETRNKLSALSPWFKTTKNINENITIKVIK